MSKRKTTPSVTLFPFLAVLVCTMGALILLLLVTTRRIRQQELERLAADTAVEVPVEVPVIVSNETDVNAVPILITMPESAPEPEDSPLLPTLYDDFEDRLAERQRLIRQKEAEYAQAMRDRDDQAADLQQRIQSDIAAALTLEQQLQAELESVTAELDQVNELLATVTAQRQTAQQLISGKKTESTELRDRFAKLRAERSELEALKDKLEGDLAKAVQNKQKAAPKFQVVAYDGESGTTRRPILIECRDNGLSFAAERITLTPRELNGFPPEANPLQAGTAALYEYWRQQNAATESDEAPYVLLIVRPGGTDAFYVARKLLEEWDHQYGYELIGTSDEIQWPEPDDGAVLACRTAIEAMLSQRERIASQLKTGRLPMPAELMFAAPDNTFQLPEIENIRERRRGFSLGGANWLPERTVKNRYESDAQAPGVADNGPPASFFPGQDGLTADGSGSMSSDRIVDGSIVRSAPEDFRQEGMGKPPAELFDGTPSASIGEIPPRSPSNGVTFIPSTIEPTGQPQVFHGRQPSKRTAKVYELEPRSEAGQDFRGSSQGSSRTPSGPGGSSRVPQGLQPLDARGGMSSGSPNPFSQGAPSGRASPQGVEQRREFRPQNAIGIERETVIHLYADHVRIDEVNDAVPATGTREQFQHDLTSALAGHTSTWGKAPSSFFWKPTVKLVIHPGGNQHLPRVTELTKAWQVETKQEYSLEQ
ncbi:MAG: hypothetical protein KDA80_22220 [Planctomycetaceae bacterium]|nr:hypothetical protein [Planctomycetaceae bacterium]